MNAVVDTNVLFGQVNRNDAHHEPASAIVSAIDDGDVSAILTDYVIAETLNLTHQKIGHDAAVDLFDRINDNSNIRVVHSPQQDYHSSIEQFREYEDLSFVDASIVAFMERAEIETLYSFDTDFDAVDDLRRAESV
jgi:predicted nucleic acid-binding protein